MRQFNIDTDALAGALDARGYAVLSGAVSPETCAGLADLYDGPQDLFRSTVTMARYAFG